MKPYAFGVDIGGTTVKIGFFETQGNLLKKWEIPTRKDMGGSLILSDIAESLQQECKARKLKKEDIEGIGLGVPGPVLEGRIVNKCVNLGWGVIDIAAEMSRLTGIENIHAGNAARATRTLSWSRSAPVSAAASSSAAGSSPAPSALPARSATSP